MTEIPFNRPYATGAEFGYIEEAIANAHLSGNGPFARRCASWLEETVGSSRALLTHSCTAALEMAAILAGIGPGDEVIVPSFTLRLDRATRSCCAARRRSSSTSARTR